MLMSPASGAINTGNLQGLLQNPTLLQNLIPGVNLSGLAQSLKIELAQEEAPLQQMSQQQVTLSGQSKAWSQVSSALQAVQNDAAALSTVQDMNPSSAPVSSDPTLVTASGTGAAQGTYNVSVSSLAAPQITNSNVVSLGSGTALGYSGTLTLTYNGSQASVTVTTSDTLSTIAQNLTAAAASLPGLNLSASALPSGSGAVLSLAANTGSGSFSISASGSNLPMSFTTVQSSADAVYTVNGVQNQSPVNVIQNSLAPGVSLSLLGVTSSPVSLTVSANPSAVAQNVNQLVNDIQSAVTTLNKVAGQGGPLEGSAALLQVGQQLVSLLSQTNSALPPGDQSLLDAGLGVSWSQNQGEQVTFDSAAFTQALIKNPSAITTLFAGSSGATANGGIAQGITQYLKGFLNASTGIIASAQSGITQQEQTLTNDQNTLQQLVQQQQQSAQNQFLAALQTLLKEASLQQTLDAQFKLSNGSNNSTSVP